MIVEVYLLQFVGILVVFLMIGFWGGYVIGHGFKGGDQADTNQFNILLKEEQKKREAFKTELELERTHSKQLEEALETMIMKESGKKDKPYTEMHKDHNKVLVDPESSKAKIPERKVFRRRKNKRTS